MLDVLADGPLGLAEEFGELLLVESYGLILQPHVQLRAPVFGLVKDDLVHDGCSSGFWFHAKTRRVEGEDYFSRFRVRLHALLLFD